MVRLLAFGFRLCVGFLFGAQLFFAAVAAPAAFPREIAQQAPASPARRAAADLVGRMLAQLDRLTIALCAVAALCAIALGRAGLPRARIAAAPVLLAGLAALLSSYWVTPQIHAMRALGTTSSAQFATLHAVSTALLAVEIALLLWALWVAPLAQRE
jgi:glucan phosphoethanolaminetransferase (alkaline phosphatase superfamily)